MADKALDDPKHILVYSDSGGGKSTFFSTFPKPLIVFFFDPFGKERPYLRVGDPLPLEVDERGTPFRCVMSRKTGKLLVRVEYYNDPNPHEPTAYARFLSRMAEWDRSGEVAEWKSCVLDSVTFMELSARKQSQYVLKPHTKEPRQWFADSTDACEEVLMSRFGSMAINVGVSCHVDDSKTTLHGEAIRAPNAPGRMRKFLAAGYSEVYHLSVGKNEEGEIERWLQTVADEEWMAGTQIDDLPPFVLPHYKALKPR